MQIAAPVRPQAQGNPNAIASSRGSRIVLALMANALLALSAHIALPLYFTPVPITLQTFVVLLMGLLLGPSLAFTICLLYLAEGAMGLPVFSPMGPGGMAQLLGPTGGFLLAFPFAAAVAGFAVRGVGAKLPRFGGAVIAGAAASVVSFMVGGLWIAHLAHSSWHMTAKIAVLPFVPGEVIKIMAAAGVYASVRRFVRH